MVEYARQLRYLMQAQKDGYQVQYSPEQSDPRREPAFASEYPFPHFAVPLTDSESEQASNISLEILKAAATLAPLRKARYRLIGRIGGGIETTVTGAVLQWGSNPELSAGRFDVPYLGDGETTHGISIEIVPKGDLVATLRRNPYSVVPLGGRNIQARAFIKHPQLLLPDVAQTLNSILSETNLDRQRTMRS